MLFYNITSWCGQNISQYFTVFGTQGHVVYDFLWSSPDCQDPIAFGFTSRDGRSNQDTGFIFRIYGVIDLRALVWDTGSIFRGLLCIESGTSILRSCQKHSWSRKDQFWLCTYMHTNSTEDDDRWQGYWTVDNIFSTAVETDRRKGPTVCQFRARAHAQVMIGSTFTISNRSWNMLHLRVWGVGSASTNTPHDRSNPSA